MRRFSNPPGRPRTLEREIARLEQAAAHIYALTMRRYVIAALTGDDAPELTEEDHAELQAARELSDRAALLRLLADEVRDLVAELTGQPSRVPRVARERPSAPPAPPIDPADQRTLECMALGALLDRLIPEEVCN